MYDMLDAVERNADQTREQERAAAERWAAASEQIHSQISRMEALERANARLRYRVPRDPF